MRKSLFALLLVAAGALQSAYAAVTLRPDHPDSYTVVRGDTLWDIAGKFLSKPWEWPEIWQANPQIKNPNLIYPGDTLVLSYVDGQPRLQLNRGASRGTIRLSPTVRSTPITEAVPAIPLEAVNSFLLQNRAFDSAEQFQLAPYVVAGNAERVVSGAGDRIYVRGKLQPGVSAFGIYRQGKTYVDPKTGAFLAINGDLIGNAVLVAQEGDIATLQLTRTSQEVRIGDRLFPTEERLVNSSFMPSAPDRPINNGVILDVPRGVTQVGQYDVVTLNKGTRDGLVEGDVLAVYKTGETVRDRITGEQVKIPDERAGLLMVFRTYDKISYGLVLLATRQLSIMDKVRNP